MHLEVILWLDQRVMCFRKIDERFSRPGTTVSADVDNVLRAKAKTFEGRKEAVQASVGCQKEERWL